MTPWSLVSFLIFSSVLTACGGHEAQTQRVRNALDAGQNDRAIALLNQELDVKTDGDLPGQLEGDHALLVLDRGSVQQARNAFSKSKRDFEAADKAIEMLDLSQNAGDSIVKYMYSDSGGKYKAPPYEKLLINTMNMINYLELGDLNGARVEARRFAVTRAFLLAHGTEATNPILGLGSWLAGLTFEKSGESNEALRFYEEAIASQTKAALEEPVARLLPLATFRSPALETLARGGARRPLDANTEGELIVLIGHGRVPHKIAKRVPIGLALTYFSSALAPNDVATANRLAAQGLVTWINYPSLAPATGDFETPLFSLDGQVQPTTDAAHLSSYVTDEWKSIEGKIVASAITRLASRYLVGEGIRRASGDSLIGVLASLGTQATLTALDTPDTRSWEALPARVSVARMRLAPGKHTIRLAARGTSRQREVNVTAGNWNFVSLSALR